MTQYESQIKVINAPVERVYGMLSNLENLRPIIQAAQDNDMLRQQMEQAGQDPSVLEKLKDVQLTEDYIGIPAPMVGEISMRIIEREENKTIKFATDQSPVDANMWIQVLPTTAAETQEATKMRLTLKADLNPMIKMMVGSKLKDGIDKFADMLAMIKY
jgi:carbon monoxide dehydrogenase subunit G